MSALDRLSNLLRASVHAADKPLPTDSILEAVIAQLEKHTKAGTSSSVPDDLQHQAVRRFWESPQFETLRDARLVSFGMCLPSRPSGPCIMEDRQRFQAVLDSKTGIDQWLDSPRWYRRCYQGLVRSYFTYDVESDQVPTTGRKNWGDLRDYLHDRTRFIVDKKVNPDWVTTAVDNRNLFTGDPCLPYAESLLQGDSSTVDRLCEQLGVIKASWFLRELVLAQVRQATRFGHEKFKELIPALIELLSKNEVLRDRGLILMLDKYASAPHHALNEHLRNASVDWWGNPWLPSNEMRWGGVVRPAREMVSEWLKREFIEAFFTKLAEDGVGDRRRANFWLRYAKSMDNIQFALGARAMHSTDRDFVALRKKMKGLYTELKTTDSSNNAFIMTIGDLVAVEFGGMGNAFYGYDIRKILPFDASQPVGTTVNAKNSLKHKNRLLWMQHQDGIKGWDTWEHMFEATLKDHFDIKPNAASKRNASRVVPSPSAASLTTDMPNPPRPDLHQSRVVSQGKASGSDEPRFSLAALDAFARARQLKVEDFFNKGGNLWIRADDSNLEVNKVLLQWQFKYKPGKGWWR